MGLTAQQRLGEVCSEVAVGAGHGAHGFVLLEIRGSYSEGRKLRSLQQALC